MKKQLLLLVTMLLPMMASAYDIAVKNADGVTIYYNYVNNATELEVTNDGYKSYSGSVDIPEEVTYMNRTRKVTRIGNEAFSGSELTSVTIPNSVTSIGKGVFYGWDLPKVISKIENPFTINTNTFSDNTFYIATLYVPKGTIDKYKAQEGWKNFALLEEGNGDYYNELINYPVAISGINLFASDNSQVSFSTIFIKNNSIEVDCIRFGKSYKYTDNEYFYAKLSVAGGFKVGDVIEIAGAYNNQDTKNSAISFRIDPTSSSPIWTTDNFINGRYSSEEPRIQTYTLTTDADVLYFGRSGNTGTGITYLKVKRKQEVLPTDIVINDTNFPDANFRNYLLSQSFGSDGVITEAEIAGVKEIDVSNRNITSLEGIEFFTALTGLICYNNQLTTLDVTKNTMLTRFWCEANQLTTLDVSKNTALKELYCSDNPLTTLDVTNNTMLTELLCYNNQLTTLDVTKNTMLTRFWCTNNQLTTLDVSKNTALQHLTCGNNQLTTLDVSKNTALQDLDCGNNQLTTLDVSKNTALKELKCYNNQLTSLDVSKNTALQHLTSGNNQLTTLDVSKNTALQDLDCGNNQLTTLDVSKNTALKELKCYNNQLTSLDVSKNTALQHLTCGSNQLTTLDVSKNTMLTQFLCYNNQLTSLDVSKNTALQHLTCGNNQLTTLDVSKNTALQDIDCGNNQLTTLDVSKNTALLYLNCYDNQLTTLDVSNNTMLTTLWCEINQLTTLDVTKNTMLTGLKCSSNLLTTLDVTKNTKLTSLSCYKNQIKGAEMDALVESLPKQESAEFYVYVRSVSEGNVCTTEQVNIAKQKGWKVLYYNQDKKEWEEYAGSEPIDNSIAINESNFPDANFRNYLLSQSFGSDGVITEAEIAGVKEINVSNHNITSLEGIEFFTALTRLFCLNNQLTTLDVSKNTALLYLDCYDNQLTTLDVSKNTALQTFGCKYNQLKDLDISKNTMLTRFWCGNNQLTTLDVSNNTMLTELWCDNNQLTTLDVSNNTMLTEFGCGSNQLTTLDVSKNTALQHLKCGNNQLTTLDVSKNTALQDLDCFLNQLTTLDVSKNTKMIELWCFGNQIKGVEMDALVESFPKQESAECYVYKNSGSEGNVCTTEQVNIAKQKGWKVLYYNQDKKEWEEYAGSEPIDNSIAINESNFPDANFRNYLLSQSFGSDGVITEAEIAGVKEIDVSNHNITSLEGIEFFTALEKLYCEENLLTVLDVSKNTALFSLNCWTNRLTSIDVSKNIALQNLVCYNNQLTTLDVLKNTALLNLKCAHNQLTTLDVSKNTALLYLDCYDNQLTTLDVSKNTALQIFSCDYNQLKDLDISKNTMLTQLGCDNNQLITLDVSKNTKLEKLYCAQNKLTTLDVSNHKDLWQFYCSKNQLTTLNISKDVPLVFFECYQNQIKGTAMDALVENLTISKTSMQAMRVIYNEDEGNEMTVEQVNKVKEKGWIPYYFDGSKWLEYLGSNPNEIVVNAVSYEVTGNKVVVKSGRNTSGNVLIPSTITIDGQTYQVTGIGDGAFKGNTAITSVTISEGITRIGAEAFEGCTNLKEIIIGKDVTAIADKAFANIIPSANAPRRAGGVVLTVYCYVVNVPQTAANAFENTPIDKALLLVEDSSLSDYSNVEPWKDFGTIQGFNGGSGINAIWAGEDSNVKIYTIDGKLLDKPQKGVNIVRMSNGTIKKVVVK